MLKCVCLFIFLIFNVKIKTLVSSVHTKTFSMQTNLLNLKALYCNKCFYKNLNFSEKYLILIILNDVYN